MAPRAKGVRRRPVGVWLEGLSWEPQEPWGALSVARLVGWLMSKKVQGGGEMEASVAGPSK